MISFTWVTWARHWRKKTENLPDALKIRNSPSTSNMSPSTRNIGPCNIRIIPYHLTQLLPSLHLRHRSKRTRFNGDIVWVIQHSHEISQDSWHAQVHAHVGSIARIPPWNGMLAKDRRSCLHGIGNFVGFLSKSLGLLDGFTDEWLYFINAFFPIVSSNWTPFF